MIRIWKNIFTNLMSLEFLSTYFLDCTTAVFRIALFASFFARGKNAINEGGPVPSLLASINVTLELYAIISDHFSSSFLQECRQMSG